MYVTGVTGSEVWGFKMYVSSSHATYDTGMPKLIGDLEIFRGSMADYGVHLKNDKVSSL